LDTFEVDLEDAVVGEDVIVVAERAVEDAALAVGLCPSDAEVLIFAVDVLDCHVGLFWVKAEEHVVF